MKVSIALLFIGSLAFAGEPNTRRRTVQYHATDIVTVSAELGFTTLIELPKEESILEVSIGDKEYWPTNWTGNLAYIKPAKKGGRTNFNLITASGNVYSFLVSEVSGQADGHVDLRVLIDPSDAGSIAAMKGQPKYVSADAVEGYKKAAEQAQAQLKTEQAAAQKDLEREKTELRATYPSTIKHDYTWDRDTKAARQFGVKSIWSDAAFTYIDVATQETPSFYEVKDGKPSLIQFTFKDGVYVAPKIVSDGYLAIGKSKLTFHREGA